MTNGGIIVNVLYGTVTGNAEEIGRNIHNTLAEKNIGQGLFRCLADYKDIPAFTSPKDHSHNTYNIIIVSTTGDGDAPDSIRPFMKLLRNKDTGLLEGLNYTVLALGDTNYANFCRTGKRIDTGLSKLGGVKFYDRGDADDGTGLEIVVEPWIKGLYEKLSSFIGTANVESIVEQITKDELQNYKLPKLPIPKVYIQQDNIIKNDELKNKVSIHTSYNKDDCYITSIHNVRLLTSKESEKVVWHMELICNEQQQLQYKPGDAFGMIVHNKENEVKRFIACNKYNNDMILDIYDNNNKQKILQGVSIQRIISEQLDIRSIPSKTLLYALSQHTTDNKEREHLCLLSSKEGRQDYKKCIIDNNVNVLTLLETICPSCVAPIEVFLNFLPSIPMRWYSITSSSLLDGNHIIHFTFSVVPNGLATTFLSDQCQQFLNDVSTSSIVLKPRESDLQSHFHPPSSLSTPYIMIGPGTGVAPFRGFLRERKYLIDHAEDNAKSSIGDTILFFGCRHKQHDFLYEQDLNDLVDNHTLSNLYVAFSRDSDTKVYVQTKMKEHYSTILSVLRNNGCIFVCGDGGQMAKDVHNTLTQIVTQHLTNGDIDDGNKYMEDLKKQNRYVRDIWYFG